MDRPYVFKKRWKRAAAAAFDAAGQRLFRSKDVPPPFGRTLVVRLDHLGDVLAATAIPRMIREARPGARVSFLTAGWAAPLLANNPDVEEVLTYDAPWFARRGPSKTRGFFATAREIADRNFDTAVAPRGDLRENLLLKLANVPARLGFGITGGGFFLTRESVWRPDVHETAHARTLLADSGLAVSDPGPQIRFTDAEETAWVARASALGVPVRGAYVGFQASAGTPSKEWGSDRARRFIAKVRKMGVPVVLTGTLSDRRRVPVPETDGVLDLRGETSLRELLLLVRGCRAFVGPDSGPTHVASALGVPTLFLYSGTNRFERWRPLPAGRQGSPIPIVLRREVPCAPCALETCAVPGHPCMAGIDPEDAARALAEVIA